MSMLVGIVSPTEGSVVEKYLIMRKFDALEPLYRDSKGGG